MYKCQEDEAPLDLSTLTVRWERVGAILEGEITCNQRFKLTGKGAQRNKPKLK